jgi:hypothetical protein
MRKKLFGMLIALLVVTMVLVTGCGTTDDGDVSIEKPPFMTGEDMDADGGADLYGAAGDNAESRYFVINDYYNMTDDENLTIIEKYEPVLQTTEWTCGVSMASCVLYNFGFDQYSEQLCSVDADSNDETGTSLEGLIAMFEDIPEVTIVESAPYGEGATDKPSTFSAMSLYASENSDDTEAWVDKATDSYFVKWLTGYLQRDVPIMVDWSDWGGHWQAIIGYDTNGTDGIGDDVLIFAAPYDTTDHWEDGYYAYPLERFFYQWKEGFEPYQEQVFVVVEPAE